MCRVRSTSSRRTCTRRTGRRSRSVRRSGCRGATGGRLRRARRRRAVRRADVQRAWCHFVPIHPDREPVPLCPAFTRFAPITSERAGRRRGVTIEAFDRVHLDGTGFDRITEGEVVAVVREAIAAGRGGRIITPNVDILRRAQVNLRVKAYLDDADLIVADGMPLVWASKLSGTPLPERVAGSSLIRSLSEGLGRDGRSIFVVGGAAAAEGVTDGATRAADRLAAECPGLRIAGTLCPDYGFENDEQTYADFCAKVAGAEPDLVF